MAMTDLEKRMYCWIQISKEDAKIYSEKKGLIYEQGQFYTDNTGKRMVQYQLDACDVFHDLLKDSDYGGNQGINFDQEK